MPRLSFAVRVGAVAHGLRYAIAGDRAMTGQRRVAGCGCGPGGSRKKGRGADESMATDIADDFSFSGVDADRLQLRLPVLPALYPDFGDQRPGGGPLVRRDHLHRFDHPRHRLADLGGVGRSVWAEADARAGDGRRRAGDRTADLRAETTSRSTSRSEFAGWHRVLWHGGYSQVWKIGRGGISTAAPACVWTNDDERYDSREASELSRGDGWRVWVAG